MPELKENPMLKEIQEYVRELEYENNSCARPIFSFDAWVCLN